MGSEQRRLSQSKTLLLTNHEISQEKENLKTKINHFHENSTS